tara:strand:- start:3 stop:464 length:462 start_codon:yes stop_codon:yes gene_type:complete
MTSTLTAASLSVTITEAITLNGYDQGSTNVQTIGSINNVFKRIISVPTSEVTLVTNHASNVAGATFDEDNVKYVRITNKDDTNYIDLVVANTEADEFALRLKAGTSCIFWDQNDMLNCDNTAVTPGAGMEGIASINAIANTAVVDCEIFLAST